MISLPALTGAELRALVDDMRLGPYIARPSVQLLDLDHNLLDDLSDRVIDGQVDWKLGPVGRLGGAVSASSATLTLADTSKVVAVDGNSATTGAVFYDQMLSAGVEFAGPRLGRTIRIPLFTGPLTKAVRANGQLAVNCEGKERLATGMVGQTVTYRRGTDKLAVVKDLLIRAGEHPTRIQAPGNASNLPDDLTLTDQDLPWNSVRAVAASMNRHALYDGRGNFRVRNPSADPVWTATDTVNSPDGLGGALLTAPEVTYDGFNGYNGVRVTGPTYSGRRISVTVWLPAGHPLSPTSRKRNGVPYKRYLVMEQSLMRDAAEANEIAIAALRRMTREFITVTADILPMWLLEPGDVVAWRVGGIGYLEQTLTDFSVPLLPGAPMSLGATKPIPRPRPKPARAVNLGSAAAMSAGNLGQGRPGRPRRPRVRATERTSA